MLHTLCVCKHGLTNFLENGVVYPSQVKNRTYIYTFTSVAETSKLHGCVPTSYPFLGVFKKQFSDTLFSQNSIEQLKLGVPFSSLGCDGQVQAD